MPGSKLRCYTEFSSESICNFSLCFAFQVTTIDSIHSAVQILPTKTKPKKLIFIGSDGVRWGMFLVAIVKLQRPVFVLVSVYDEYVVCLNVNMITEISF